MGKPIPCKSHIAGSRTYEPCRDGFPQTATCAGVGVAVPICCQEELCGRLYSNSDGRPAAQQEGMQ